MAKNALFSKLSIHHYQFVVFGGFDTIKSSLFVYIEINAELHQSFALRLGYSTCGFGNIL